MALTRKLKSFVLSYGRALLRQENWRLALYFVSSYLLPIRKNCVLIESHKGEKLFGSLYYMLRHLATSDDYRHLYFTVVCTKDFEPTARTSFPGRRIKYCTARSFRYIYALATSRYLLNDVSFPTFFTRREQQLYFNTWHGTPIKALGLNVPQTPYLNMRNMQRNFLHTTHMLFPNVHTEAVLRRDFRLDGLWSGQAIRCGYPRNDVLVACSHSVDQPRGTFNVAYMPTWRGTHETLDAASRLHIAEVSNFIREIMIRAPSSMQLWVKLHPLMNGALNISQLSNVKEFPDNVEPYEHLARCAVLITDYSSVMIDFSAGKNHVILHTPDIQQYRERQSFSIEINQLPFPAYESAIEVADALCKHELAPSSAPTNALVSKLVELEDGHSTERACKAFFSTDGTGISRAAPVGRACALLLIEQQLETKTRDAFASIIDAVKLAGLSAVIATPGEGTEDPLLIELVKHSPDVNFCPTTTFPPVNTILRMLYGSTANELRRLFGRENFSFVVHFGKQSSYNHLVSDSTRPHWDCDLRQPDNVTSLLNKISALPHR